MSLTFWLLLLSAACCTAVQAVYFTHMLQLNSYRVERYTLWCRQNGRTLFSWRRLLPLLLLPLAFLPLDSAWLYGLAAVILCGAAWLNHPKKAKKPLVVTARVRRLFAAEILLLCAACALTFFFDAPYGLIWLGLFCLIPWVWVCMATLIMQPIEKAIANHYVNDARRRLADQPDLLVIGITGSYGKTSTKTFLHALLSVKYNVLMTPESYNTTMGVVRTIREQLRPSHRIFLAEMGAKNVGDIREICDLVHPTMGMITSIGEQHLETFRTVDNIIKTKFELADALPADGTLFLNGDNAYIRSRAVQGECIYYGLDSGDYRAVDIRTDLSGSHFTVIAPNGERGDFTTRLLGAHIIQNLVGCIAVAHRLGIPLADLIYPVRLLKPVEHRLQLLPNGFIDDAYNANPAGFRAALDVLAGFDTQRVLVTPGMVELGQRQAALNRELGEYAATRCDYAILVGERQAPPLKEGLLAGGFDEARLYVAPTLADALQHLHTLPAAARTVLLENDLPDNF